jgi:hypothetical protein
LSIDPVLVADTAAAAAAVVAADTAASILTRLTHLACFAGVDPEIVADTVLPLLLLLLLLVLLLLATHPASPGLFRWR